MNKKWRSIRDTIALLVLFMGFIWLYTVINLDSGSIWRTVRYFGTVFYIIAFTIFVFWGFVDEFDALDLTFEFDNQKYTIVAVVLGLILLVFFIAETNLEGFSLYGGTDILLWSWEIPKKNIFDVSVIILFPVLVKGIFQAIKAEKCSSKSMFWGMIQVWTITAAGILIFQAMNNSWMIELMFMNCVVVATATHKYLLKSEKVKTGNAVAFFLLYVLLWIVVLCVHRSAGESIAQNFLEETNSYIHQLFFYGGYASVIGLVAAMIGFLVLLARALRMGEYYYRRRQQLIYVAAFAMFTYRTVMGTLHSFGFPYPVAFPFAGYDNIIIDSIVFVVMLRCAWVNYQTDQLLYLKVSTVSELFGDSTDISVVRNVKKSRWYDDLDEDEWKNVIVECNGKKIACKLEWMEKYADSDRKVYLFRKCAPSFRKYIALEQMEDTWKEASESDCQKAVENYQWAVLYFHMEDEEDEEED